MTQRVEFRVVWKREGRRQSTRIYQGWSSAYRKAQGVLALEAVKDQTDYETRKAKHRCSPRERSEVPIRGGQVWVYGPYGTHYQIIARLDDWVWAVFYGQGTDPLRKAPETYDVEFFQQDKMRLKYDLRPAAA